MKHNNNNLIYHIYWGTAGNAGLYLDEIYKVLENAGYNQKAFVSYYYPFNYGEKVFFKHSEMEHCQLKGPVRKLMQAIELLYALCLILWHASRDKPKIVNYSYVSSGNFLILFFLKAVKKTSKCIIITCHDVVPFASTKRKYEKELNIKKKIYSLADYYLIHNSNSKVDLLRLFEVNETQVLQHAFPLMDLSKLIKNSDEEELKYDFLFIGHMRKEKGLDLLISAWSKFYEHYPAAKLCIAGNPLYYAELLEKNKFMLSEQNVDLRLGFIRDEDYVRIVRSARCVVFPYVAGTNSGVISTVVSLGRDVVTSDISMFKSNRFVPKENMFKAGDVDSLIEKMIQYERGQLMSDSKKCIEEYRKYFKEEVLKVYEKISHTV